MGIKMSSIVSYRISAKETLDKRKFGKYTTTNLILGYISRQGQHEIIQDWKQSPKEK